MRIMVYVLLALLLNGCAAQWKSDRDAALGMKLKIQRNATGDKNGIRPVTEQDLTAGDMLFSADDGGFNSLAIRLFTHTSVSHASIYLGEGEVAEAVGSGVRIISLQDALQENSLIAAYRRPDLNAQDIAAIQAFAREQAGEKYNLFGIVKQAPYSAVRKVCELPVIPRGFRHLCLNSAALITITPFSGEKYFCSQFVVAAFNHAGKPLTAVPPEWISPGDLLHMREGDIPSMVPAVPLQYIGHLSCSVSLWNKHCRIVPEQTAAAQLP
ncbi:MAG: YiiX/YebB-like N1pC/P60 family cysteine hydrolase [Neisseria sp.]|nr:YiiX/YebB-like N1pC/P60 family cysteine hydrolase [Neisseria sp.]